MWIANGTWLSDDSSADCFYSVVCRVWVFRFCWHFVDPVISCTGWWDCARRLLFGHFCCRTTIRFDYQVKVTYFYHVASEFPKKLWKDEFREMPVLLSWPSTLAERTEGEMTKSNLLFNESAHYISRQNDKNIQRSNEASDNKANRLK